MAADILIIDDEVDIRELIAGILEDEGYETRTADSADGALLAIKDRRPSLIVLDIWLEGSRLDGLELLELVKQSHPNLPVVIISGHGNVETAVSAIRKGAYDYIEKPFKVDRLILLVERALENSSLKRENTELKQKSGEDKIIGNSPLTRQLIHNIEKIAPTNSRIYITGLPGTGKELAARAIHQASHRADRPFITINSAALVAEKMEEELFGIEDANGDVTKIGAFEEGHGGTLMIDEVGDMPTDTQAKILRVLVNQQFERVGGHKKVRVDVRIITTSSRDLTMAIAKGQFREDLYHRLAVVPLHVPTLEERREDIPSLIAEFANNYCQVSGLIEKDFDISAIAMLQTKTWQGNARELRNHIERLIILKGEDSDNIISVDDIQNVENSIDSQMAGFSNTEIMSLPLREARELFEKEYLTTQISRFSGNISKTANFIGMERSALHRKLKSLEVKTEK
ncbi:MAG: sigma-54-dependent Fis family transcriptional regulator [Rhizobiales bacterium]|nr:sigma-54 dependent transcriptional regulator [Hyphomicrobiales bacterium]NRB14861.1 sigma-54-dependent Fis family transcriptional regulator [Hyphomicrobiales bacterium]